MRRRSTRAYSSRARRRTTSGAIPLLALLVLVIVGAYYLGPRIGIRLPGSSSPAATATTATPVDLQAGVPGVTATEAPTASSVVVGAASPAGALSGHAGTGAPPPATPLPATAVPLVPTSTATQAQPTQSALPLAGHRVGLDPGHGPRGDAGAVAIDPNTGKLVVTEADFNLDVALRARDILRARGADVVMTRETADTFTAPWPADVNGDGVVAASGDDLQERVDIFNKARVEAFISIHANSARSAASRQDVQVWYCGNSDCVAPAKSKQLGALVAEQLKEKLATAGYQVDATALLDDFTPDETGALTHLFVLGPPNPPRHVRGVQMPGVLAETLYVNLPSEAQELKKSSVRQAIALAYADALQAYVTGNGSGQ